MTNANTTETLLNLDPTQVIPRSNIRFGLKQYRIDRLAEDIINNGGVHTAITVSANEDGTYNLVFGTYRHAAVSKLNNEQNMGLTLPARVIPAPSEKDLLMLQVSENNERENMSPMDKAYAIQKMLATPGITKMDVRKAFGAAGGRKGQKIQPASNSHINMITNFLEFPKKVQNMIHDGILGIGAANELHRNPKDKWDAILEREEAARIKGIDKDDADEKKYLEQSAKADTAEQAVEEITTAINTLTEEAAAAKKLADEKATAVAEALRVRITAAKGKEREKAEEVYKAAYNDLKAAQQVAEAKDKELAKQSEKATSLSDKAKEARERLEAAQKAKAAKKAAAPAPAADGKIKGKDIKKAAKAVAPDSKPKPLNAAEMRDAVKSITILPAKDGKHNKTLAIGALIMDCFDGKINDGQLALGISRVVGEEAMPTVPTPIAGKKK